MLALGDEVPEGWLLARIDADQSTASLSRRTVNAFDAQLLRHRLILNRDSLQTLQVNLGRRCNQACRHCHVDAAPWRTETMSQEVAERVADWIRQHRPAVVDLTGGAPELCEHFRMFVQVSRASGARVMDRNNLTILEEPGFEDLAEFLAANEVEVVASLPCYSEDNVNRQRGAGVFERSIRGLRLMCRSTLSVGYDGSLYDCDFNQMLELPLGASTSEESRALLWDLDPGELKGRPIQTGQHCLACTAGSGSSCTGQVVA